MKIKQALNSYATDGSIFKYLPMYGTATPQEMGLAYVLRHSGQKTTSSLVDEFTDLNGNLTEEGKQTIAGIIKTMFKEQWDRIYEALIAEYNPLENYNMHEEGYDDTTDTKGRRSTSFVHGAQSESHVFGAQNNSLQYGEKSTEFGSQSNSYTEGSQTKTLQYGPTSETNSYGQHTDTHEKTTSAFNSNNYLPEEKVEDKFGSHTDTKTSLSKTDTEGSSSRTDLESKGQRTDIERQHTDTENRGAHTDSISKPTYTDTETTQSVEDNTRLDYEHSRTGNIGVTTSQQMLESELNIRAYRFFEKMFADIDSLIALRVYYDDDKDTQTYDTSNLNIGLQRLADGVKIFVYKNGVVQDVATVYDGVTPDFKLEDGDLYVKP